jgi:hypothetical protein
VVPDEEPESVDEEPEEEPLVVSVLSPIGATAEEAALAVFCDDVDVW